MKKTKPRYDDKFRSSAVLMLESEGYPHQKGALTRVATHLKVPPRTLSRWCKGEQNPPPDQLVNEKRETLVEQLEALAYKIVGVMPEKLEEATLQQAATSLGIIIDKWQLLTGKPTENVQLTVEERSTRIAELLDTARTRRTGQPSSDVLH